MICPERLSGFCTRSHSLIERSESHSVETPRESRILHISPMPKERNDEVDVKDRGIRIGRCRIVGNNVGRDLDGQEARKETTQEVGSRFSVFSQTES